MAAGDVALAKPDLQSAAAAVPGVTLGGKVTSVPPMATITQVMSGVSNDSFTEIVRGSKKGTWSSCTPPPPHHRGV